MSTLITRNFAFLFCASTCMSAIALSPLCAVAEDNVEAPAPVSPAQANVDEVNKLDGEEDIGKLLREMRQRIDAVELENQSLRVKVDGLKVPEPKKDEGSPLDMKATWNHGLEIKSKDKKFRVHVGGRTQFDTVFLNGGDTVQNSTTGVGQLQDGSDFRRGRLRVDGTMYDFIDWTTEIDFFNTVNLDPLNPAKQNSTSNVPAPTDLWMAFTKLPYVGNIKVGNFKEFIGFEHLTSSRYLNFMERSYNQDAFTGPFNNGFTPGIGTYNTYLDEQATFSIGLFKNNNNAFAWGLGDGEYAVTGRGTYLLQYEDEGRHLAHLGASFSHRDTVGDTARVRARGSLRSGPGNLWSVYANTGTFNANTQDLVGLEFVAVQDRLTFQSEYMISVFNDVNSGGIDRGNVLFQGGYAEVLYFLTDDHQHYSKKTGVFERVLPNSVVALPNCDECGGWGAWQVACRYNYLNLDNGGIHGNTLDTVVFGVNWFMNPNAKVQANYEITKRNSFLANGDGWINGFGMRLAYDF